RAHWRNQALTGRGQDPWFSTQPGRVVEEPPILWHDLLGPQGRALLAGTKGTALPKEMLDWPEGVRELLFLRQFDVAGWFATQSKSPNLKSWMSYLQQRYRDAIRFEKGEPRLNYPLGYAPMLLGAANRHGVDPLLLAALVREARPDLIALTGDLLDHHTPDPQAMWRFVEELRAVCPAIYYVTGNHEWWHPQRKPFVAGLAERGVVVVNNDRAVFRQGALTINVCGVDDAYTGHDDLDRALQGLDPTRFTLLLSHSPAPARRLAGRPVDLMLAGHTHGGQVRLPVVGALVAPGEGFFPELDKGLFPLGGDQHLYIDSGLGTSIAPIRLFNRSQLSLLTVTGRP
ncbi:MAG: metallophosphoesterase, partial [Candidatus Sericytochromatia bacterium]